MKSFKRYGSIIGVVTLVALASLGSQAAQAATPSPDASAAPQASASWLAKNPVAVAKAADAAGYIIVPSSDSFAYGDGTMYPTGPISPDTLVVIQNPDGTLPSGLTKSSLDEIVTMKRQGLDPQSSITSLDAKASPNTDVGILSSSAWQPGSNGGWGKAVSLGSLWGFDSSARAGYSYNTFAPTGASGNGLGYEYKCVSSTYCGQVAAYYFVGIANQYTGYYTGGSVPWGNVAANRMFMGRCTQTTICGGTAS